MAFSTEFPAAYEVRRLEPHHLDWAAALAFHSHIFHSPVWTVIYESSLTARVYNAFNRGKYLFRHSIESGHSYGIFDKNYCYKREGSAATGGQLYWDTNDLTTNGFQLLEQMDFPLVSVAFSYDAFLPPDDEKMAGLFDAFPLYATILHYFDLRDPTPAMTRRPDAPGKVLIRSSTCTNAHYVGQGLMKALAHFVMRDAAAQGFRGIQIDCLSDSVHRVWLNPLPPFRGELLSELETAT